MPTLRMLLVLFVALAAAPVAAQPDSAGHRLSSPVLRPFGSDAAFHRWLEQTRAEAQRRGDWWYAALRVHLADSSGDSGRWGLEILPGTHGGYDVGEARLANGDQLYYSQVDLTHVRPGIEPVWPGIYRRGRVAAGETIGPPDEIIRNSRRHPLWSLGEIYQPVRDTLEPVIHSLTICRWRSQLRARPDGCRTTAFVGPRGSELKVTGTHAYVWTWPELGDLEAVAGDPACAARAAAIEAAGLPSLVYRLPLAGGPLEVLGTRGAPAWGSGFRVVDGRLRALVAWADLECEGEPDRALTAPPARLTLLDAPVSLFGRSLVEAPRSFEADLPAASTAAIRVLFAGEWLLYGDLSYEFDLPYDEDAASSSLFAVPVERAADVRPVPLPHSLVAIGQAGSRAFVTGYRDHDGLEVSVLDLAGEPRIVSSIRLPGLRQRAGVSGRIDTTVRPDGSVLIALPVSPINDPSETYCEGGCASGLRRGDPVYLLVDRAGRIGRTGRPRR